MENQEKSIEQQIHESVYSAEALIIKQVEEILSRPFAYDQERYNRLKTLHELGFSKAEEVAEFKRLSTEKKDAEDRITKINYYKHQYPFSRFIDQESVKIVCEKYGLLLTFVRDYIAEIPEKNQNEIIKFRVKRKDTREPSEMYSITQAIFNIRGIWDYSDFSESYHNEMLPLQNALIIAPAHKLDVYGKEVEGHIVKIKDPIVLQPVTYGYLIVSSWGLEAGDELVVNSINN